MKKYLKFIPLIIVAVVAISFVTSRGGKLQIGEPAKNNAFELVVTEATKHYDSIDVEFTLKNTGKDVTAKMIKHGGRVSREISAIIAVECDGMIFMEDFLNKYDGAPSIYSDLRPLDKGRYSMKIPVPSEALNSGEKVYIEVKLPRKHGFASVYKYEI